MSMTPQEELIYRFKTWADGKGYITRAWLFGSRAKGTARENSDWDIAIELHARDEQQGAFFREHVASGTQNCKRSPACSSLSIYTSHRKP